MEQSGSKALRKAINQVKWRAVAKAAGFRDAHEFRDQPEQPREQDHYVAAEDQKDVWEEAFCVKGEEVTGGRVHKLE